MPHAAGTSLARWAPGPTGSYMWTKALWPICAAEPWYCTSRRAAPNASWRATQRPASPLLLSAPLSACWPLPSVGSARQ